MQVHGKDDDAAEVRAGTSEMVDVRYRRQRWMRPPVDILVIQTCASLSDNLSPCPGPLDIGSIRAATVRALMLPVRVHGCVNVGLLSVLFFRKPAHGDH